jgi:nicotinic acid mononucleotide adenylyltransferase
MENKKRKIVAELSEENASQTPNIYTKKIKLFDVPLLNISSTYIREILHASKSIHYLVPEKARLEILRLGLYQ